MMHSAHTCVCLHPLKVKQKCRTLSSNASEYPLRILRDIFGFDATGEPTWQNIRLYMRGSQRSPPYCFFYLPPLMRDTAAIAVRTSVIGQRRVGRSRSSCRSQNSRSRSMIKLVP